MQNLKNTYLADIGPHKDTFKMIKHDPNSSKNVAKLYLVF